MLIRPILASIVVGGVLLAEAGTASAAVSGTIRASQTGSAQQLAPTPRAQCSQMPVTPADFKCRFAVTTTFRNSSVHGVIQGVVVLDNTDVGSAGCSRLSGRLTDFVFRNNGAFLGSFTQQIQPTESTSCRNPQLPDVSVQLLKSVVVSGTGVYAHQEGSVESHTASVQAVNPNEPSLVIAGTFIADLHR